MGDARQHYDLARGLEKLNLQCLLTPRIVHVMQEAKAALQIGNAVYIRALARRWAQRKQDFGRVWQVRTGHPLEGKGLITAFI